MDKAKLIIKSSDILSAVEDIAKTIDATFGDQDLVLVCVLKGAAYFTVDLSRMLETNHSVYFVDASSYDGQKRKEVFIKTKLVADKFVGKKIIILDELIDSGHTLLNIKKAFLSLNKIKPEDIITCVAMNKVLCDKKRKVMEADIVGINVPDVWLIGYGLDSGGYCRNLLDVYAVPKVDSLDKTEDDLKVFGY